MSYKLQRIKDKKLRATITSTVVSSREYKGFLKAYAKNEWIVKEAHLVDARYLTSNLSAVADLTMKMIVAELQISLRHTKDGLNMFSSGFALLSELKAAETASYELVSFGDIVIPTDDTDNYDEM